MTKKQAPARQLTKENQATVRKRSLAAKKGWRTRRAKAKARSVAAKRGWETRRKNQAASAQPPPPVNPLAVRGQLPVVFKRTLMSDYLWQTPWCEETIPRDYEPNEDVSDRFLEEAYDKQNPSDAVLFTSECIQAAITAFPHAQYSIGFSFYVSTAEKGDPWTGPHYNRSKLTDAGHIRDRGIERADRLASAEIRTMFQKAAYRVLIAEVIVGVLESIQEGGDTPDWRAQQVIPEDFYGI